MPFFQGRKKAMSAKGFTLIELLIVVLIIAILAAIAVPNFLEFQVRAKVSRCHADMRTIATAIECYAVEHGAYMQYYVGVDDSWQETIPIGIVYSYMTTPVACMTSVPFDPFLPDQRRRGWHEYYRYISRKGFDDTCPGTDDCFAGSHSRPDGSGEWMLKSFGPDLVENYTLFQSGVLNWGSDTENIVYDPSNGTVSIGDIFRWGP
jgi:prepilin-type N-terminal cleavage/methylation domain-containing protein